MSRKKGKPSRRELLQMLGAGSLLTPFCGGLSPFTTGLLGENKAFAQTESPHRFLQIFLNGGADSALMTDPATGGKSANYTLGAGNVRAQTTAVGGGANPNLILGYGLRNAQTAFQTLPATIVNGLYVEVTAHELAVNYLYSGQLSLSRSREYPAAIATMADVMGGFPSHVVFGATIPLGDTKGTNPPLQAGDVSLLNMMLAGPREASGTVLTDGGIAASHNLLDALNTEYTKRIAKNSNESLNAWQTSESGLVDLYGQSFHTKMDTTAQQGPYNFTDNSSLEARMAGAYLALNANLSRFVTVNFGNFDTHQGHEGAHVPLLDRFATALNQLVADLVATPDTHPGASGGQSLADNTTILITTEFNRTPMYNGAAGTDHWTSGNAILMGRGVKADTVFGSTDDEGHSRNTAGTTRILTSTDAGVLLPDHLAAAIMRHFGFTEQANEVSEVDISAQIFNT